MNIGMVCYPTFGGSGVVATELGKALAKRGHSVHFITYSQPPRLDDFFERIFFHEVDIPPYPLFKYAPYETALASSIVDLVKYNKLDLVHVHYAIPHASAAYLAKQILKTEGYQIPVITTLHGTDITLVGKNASYAPVVAFSINQSDAVTAVSEDLKKDTLNLFNIKKDISVIPNFIDLESFKHQPREHFKKAIAPSNEKLLVHTSNFRKVKRVQDVIEVFKGVKEKIPAKLLLIGDGPERNKIEKLCREYNLCSDVRFLGKLRVVEEVLSISDLFLMPSEKESFGLAALEAMACEVPVVSSNAGGLPELIQNGLSGFVCNLGDINSMVSKSLEILNNDNLLTFKKNAFNRSQQYNVSKIVPMYEDIYKQLLNE